MSHEEYLGERAEAVEWMLHIHALYVRQGLNPITGERRGSAPDGKKRGIGER